MKLSAEQIILRVILVAVFIGLLLGCSKKEDDDKPAQESAAEEVLPLETAITSPTDPPFIYTGDSVFYESSVTGGKEPYTFSWDFDGDGTEDSNEEDPGEVTYNNAGSFTAILCVTDARGDILYRYLGVIINKDLDPVVTIDSPSENVTTISGSAVRFYATSTGGNEPLTYSWDFGGGAENVSVEDPGTVIFYNAGLFPVIFSATDANGDVASDSVLIAVNEYIPEEDTIPEPAIISPLENNLGCVEIFVGDVLDFQGSVEGGNQPLRYQWSFPGGDPGTSSVEDPGPVVYNNMGSFNATFTVIDRDLDIARHHIYIRVSPRSITVPDVSGMGVYEAIAALEREYLIVKNVYCEYSDDTSALEVISQSPAGGSPVLSGTSVNLTISLGAVDNTAYWSQKGAVVNSNTLDLGIWLAEYDFPIAVGSSFTGYTEHVLNLSDTNYVTTWNGSFSSVPPCVLENVDVSEEQYSVPIETSGSISGSGTITFTRISIQSGSYAGQWFVVGTYELIGLDEVSTYTGSIYGFGTTEDAAWEGLFEGDINGLYFHNASQGTMHITSMSGVQTCGTVVCVWGTPLNNYSLLHTDLELLAHDGLVWSGTGSGFNTGDYELDGASIYLPMYRVGEYIAVSNSDDQFNSCFSFSEASEEVTAMITSPSSDVTIVQGETVDFRGYISGTRWPYAFTWDFNGDGIADSTELNPRNYEFNTVGNFSASFTVTDRGGNSYTDSINITVNEMDIEPVAVINTPSEDIAIFLGSSLTFEGSVSGGNNPLALEWDYETDGIADMMDVLSLTCHYTSIGTFPMTFTATDRDGDVSSDTINITVSTMQIVPDITGMSFSDALTAVSAENLDIGVCHVEYDANINAGNIIGQNPPAGTGVFPGSMVDLTVSLGPVDPNAFWSCIGLTTGSFPYYIPPENTPVSIIEAQYPEVFNVDTTCNFSAEYLPSLVNGENNAEWSGVFTYVPLTQWIDPVANADVTRQQTIGETGVATGDTSIGLITENITSSWETFTIENGSYAGHKCSVISWELGTYTGSIYSVGNNSSGDFLGENSPGEFWGRVDGDIRGMYRTTGLHQAVIFITSIEGTQASGTLNISWSGSNYDENSYPHDNVTLYIQEGISWSGDGSGCVTGNLVHSGTSIFLPGFNFGQYMGSWFYYESDPNNYDQSGYINTYLLKRTSSTTVVPFVEGLSQEGAEEIITSQGLYVGSVTVQSSSFPQGHVISQNPAVGQAAVQGATVSLVVAE